MAALFTSAFTFGQGASNLQVSFVSTEVNCFGTNDGTIDVSISGGIQPYTYVWNNENVASLNPSGLPIGTYIISVSDASGAVVEESIEITGPTAPLSMTLDKTNISAYGQGDGSIDAEITGGIPFKSAIAPYIFTWSNNSTTLDQTNLSAGVYVLTATDYNGCQITKSCVLFKPNVFQNNLETYSFDKSPSVGNIYPNPSTGNVTIELNDLSVDEISFYSLRTGQQIQTNFKNEMLPTLEGGEYIIYFKSKGEVIGSEKLKVVN